VIPPGDPARSVPMPKEVSRSIANLVRMVGNFFLRTTKIAMGRGSGLLRGGDVMVDKAGERRRLFAKSRGLPGAGESRQRAAAVAQRYLQAAGLARAAEAKMVAATSLGAAGVPVWRPLGPDAIANGQTKLGTSRVTVSGRIAAVAIDPNDSQHILVGAAAGGIWRSGDAGATWSPRTDDQVTLTIGAIAFDPANPRTVYAGTGEGNSYWPLGQGLLRSNDAGETWAPLTSVLAGDPSTNPFQGQGFFDLFVDPTDSNHLLAGTTVGVHETVNGREWTACSGPGECWDLSVSVRPGNGAGSQGREILAACQNGIYQWAGAGQPWRRVALPVPVNEPAAWTRLAVAHAPSNPAVAYALGTYPVDDSHTSVFLFQRSESGWRTISLPPELAVQQATYDWCIAVDPQVENRVYVGAIALHKGEFSSPMWRWSIPDGLHADQHAIVCDHRTPGVIYVGNDGGLFRSADHGTTWAALNNGLAITEIEFIAQDPNSPDWILAGTQDNGTIRYTGTSTWLHVADGDGGYCAVNQAHPDTVFHTFYCMGIERSNAKGDPNSWDPIGPSGDAYLCDSSGGNFNCLFYPPMGICPDPSSPGVQQTIAQAGQSVLVLRGAATNWVEVMLPSGCVASALCVPTPDLMYIGCDNGRLFRIGWNVASNTWKLTPLDDLPRSGQPKDPLFPDTHHWISDIFAQASQPDRVWVTSSTIPIAGVFRSDSGGLSAVSTASQTWSDCTSDVLGGIPINAVEGHPSDHDRIWIATDHGVYETINGTQSEPTWRTIGVGLPNALLEDLGFHAAKRVLRVATRSRGVWEVDVG